MNFNNTNNYSLTFTNYEIKLFNCLQSFVFDIKLYLEYIRQSFNNTIIVMSL